jgi:hypothetical protein
MANELPVAEEEMICKRYNFTTEPLGIQDKKENQ